MLALINNSGSRSNVYTRSHVLGGRGIDGKIHCGRASGSDHNEPLMALNLHRMVANARRVTQTQTSNRAGRTLVAREARIDAGKFDS